MALRVSYRPLAATDLEQIYDFIAEDSPARSLMFVRQIRQRCESLAEMPEQAPSRDDLGPGVRLLTFNRRAMVAYRVERGEVLILRVFYAGRDYQAAVLDEPDAD